MHSNTAGLIETLSDIIDTHTDRTLIRVLDAYYSYTISMVAVAIGQLEDNLITEAKETLSDLRMVGAGFIYDISKNGKDDGIADV